MYVNMFIRISASTRKHLCLYGLSAQLVSGTSDGKSHLSDYIYTHIYIRATNRTTETLPNLIF